MAINIDTLIFDIDSLSSVAGAASAYIDDAIKTKLNTKILILFIFMFGNFWEGKN